MRIILPAQFFHVIGGLLSAALQAQDLHFLPAMAPLVYSAGIIIGGLVGAQLGVGADGFAWGVLVGSALGPFALPLYGCLSSACAGRSVAVVSQSRPAALPVAVVSDHDRLLDRRRRRVDREEPGLLSRGRRAVASAIRTHPDEGADRRVRHGGRSRGLSDHQPHGGGGQRRRGLRGAEPRSAADAVCDLRGAGLPDAGRVRGDLPDLGPVLEPLQRRRRAGHRTSCSPISASDSAAGRRRP